MSDHQSAITYDVSRRICPHCKNRCHSRLTKLTDASFMTPLVTCGCLILPHNLQMKGMKKHRLVLLEKSVRTMVLRWIALQVNGTVIWVSACAFTQMHGGTQIEQVLFLCDTTGLDATQQPLNQLYSFLTFARCVCVNASACILLHK